MINITSAKQVQKFSLQAEYCSIHNSYLPHNSSQNKANKSCMSCTLYSMLQTYDAESTSLFKTHAQKTYSRCSQLSFRIASSTSSCIVSITVLTCFSDRVLHKQNADSECVYRETPFILHVRLAGLEQTYTHTHTHTQTRSWEPGSSAAST